LYKVIQRLYEREPPECVDFGEGEAEYKKTLANQITYAQSVMVVRSRLGWRLLFGVMAMKKMLIAGGVEVVARVGLKARLKKWFKNPRS